MAMSVDEILEAMRALIEAAGDDELSEEDAERYEELEKKLQTARKAEEIRARQKAYESPLKAAVHVAAPKHEDGLERAFEHYLRTGKQNSDITELRAQGEGVDSAGGFLVPPGFRQKLTERMVAFGGIAGAVETITTDTGNPIEWPTNDDTANLGEIVNEGAATAAGADLVFGTETLNAYRYSAGGAENAGVRVSVELAQDSAFSISDFVARALGTRIARRQAQHWVTGTGVNEPEGITLTGQPIGTPTNALDVTNVVDFDDLMDTMAALDPAYIENASWAFNNETLFEIRGLLDGANRPLWLPQWESGIHTLAGGVLFGFPVIIDQAFASVETSATSRPIVFGDLREAYVIRRVKDVTVLVDPYTRAANGQVTYHAWARADGIVQNRNAYVLVANVT